MCVIVLVNMSEEMKTIKTVSEKDVMLCAKSLGMFLMKSQSLHYCYSMTDDRDKKCKDLHKVMDGVANNLYKNCIDSD